MNILLNEFQAATNCKSIYYSSRESFLKISFTFKGGNIYGLVSDFGCGSWGLTTCIGGRCSDNYDGKICLDNKPISNQELTKLSCFISENTFEGINTKDNLLSAKECIETALQISKLPYTVDEIKEMFLLSDGRFERCLDNVSGEIWQISIAVGFAMGKEIFCYPWLSEQEIRCIYEPTIKFLRDHGKIVLIPSSQQRQLKKICDHMIIFKQGKYVFK